MKGYAANAQSMADVASVIEHARAEGRDIATALRIARTTLAYVSGARPEQAQAEALDAFDLQLRKLGNVKDRAIDAGSDLMVKSAS